MKTIDRFIEMNKELFEERLKADLLSITVLGIRPERKITIILNVPMTSKNVIHEVHKDYDSFFYQFIMEDIHEKNFYYLKKSKIRINSKVWGRIITLKTPQYIPEDASISLTKFKFFADDDDLDNLKEKCIRMYQRYVHPYETES